MSDVAETTQPTEPAYPDSKYAWYVTSLLLVAYILSFVDRQIMSLLIEPIKADLGLTDKAAYIERASLPDELVCPLAQAPETAPYFSMIILTKGADPWL